MPMPPTEPGAQRRPCSERKLNMCVPLLVAVLLMLPSSVWAVDHAAFTAKVIGISDGDTLTVLHERAPVKIRLDGVDAPESGQAFGSRARQAASALAFGQLVTVRPTEYDRYGRLVAEVVLPDGRVLNQELVRQGWAWWFQRYAPDNAVLAALEGEAREARRGLWADPKPTPPWDWRAEQRAGSRAGALKQPPPNADTRPIIANRRSGLYHTPGCRTYESTSLANRVLFATGAAAEAAGYRRAGSCP
jgi:micrococcal nuclease